MNISTKTRYGFRFMVYLGVNQSQDKSIQLGEVAEKENISLKYLEKIAQILKRGGWISVKRGPKGGYRLAKETRNISLLNLFETLEGSCSILDCIDDESCERDGVCSTIDVWKGLTDAIRSYLNSQTLEDLVQKYQNKNHMFYI